MTDGLVRWTMTVAVFILCVCALACSDNPQTQNANSSAPVKNSNNSASPTTPSVARYEGNHDLTNCEGVYGWAWDANQPGVTARVEIFDGDALLGTADSNILRDDLAKAGRGDGRHGFSFILPASVKDGKPHLIRVKVLGTNVT